MNNKICVKDCYVSKKDARKAASLLKQLGATGCGKKGTLIKRGRLKPYVCDICSTKEETIWHLTSKK